MYIEKSFSDAYGRQRLYSVGLNEDELALYSNFREYLYSDEEKEEEKKDDAQHKTAWRNTLGTAGGIAGAGVGYKVGSSATTAALDNLFFEAVMNPKSKAAKIVEKLGLEKHGGKYSKGIGIAAGLANAGALAGGGMYAGHLIDKKREKKASKK